MKATAGMPADELKQEMLERKLRAFDMAWQMRDLTAAELSIRGHKHPYEVILFAGKMNEARMKDWEKNNK